MLYINASQSIWLSEPYSNTFLRQGSWKQCSMNLHTDDSLRLLRFKVHLVGYKILSKFILLHCLLAQSGIMEKCENNRIYLPYTCFFFFFFLHGLSKDFFFKKPFINFFILFLGHYSALTILGQCSQVHSVSFQYIKSFYFQASSLEFSASARVQSGSRSHTSYLNRENVKTH